MKEPREIKNETIGKYGSAVTFYAVTGLSVKQMCGRMTVGFDAFKFTPPHIENSLQIVPGAPNPRIPKP